MGRLRSIRHLDTFVVDKKGHPRESILGTTLTVVYASLSICINYRDLIRVCSLMYHVTRTNFFCIQSDSESHTQRNVDWCWIKEVGWTMIDLPYWCMQRTVIVFLVQSQEQRLITLSKHNTRCTVGACKRAQAREMAGHPWAKH
ncbi:hypothetical protein BaRGS_00006296 [Batillaria attramentaria]|uniref:Uncharacterized protein n=1 Tax=Batillaria attramentaria TaxID=370345 RepID=A0ABD0LS91_9CAEN